MLPREELKPAFGKAVWLWVYRDFSANEADRAAERVQIRFGVTSYPQHFLVDPYSLEELADATRAVPSFLAAFDRAAMGVKRPAAPVEGTAKDLQRARELLAKDRGSKEAASILDRLAGGRDPYEFWLEARSLQGGRDPGERLASPDPEERALALEGMRADFEKRKGSATPDARVEALLADPDLLVRTRALELLRVTDPGGIVRRAADLLKVPNDPFRYAVLETLRDAKAAAAAAVPSVVAVFQGAGDREHPSHNPNVLRIRAAEALGECADASAVEVLRTAAQSGEYRNGLTRTCVDAIVKIASRSPPAAARAAERVLADAFPAGTDTLAEGEGPLCLALARAVQEALGRASGPGGPSFPAKWTRETREALVRAWKKRLGETVAPR